MDERQALNRLLEVGKSAELVAAFGAIAEATDPDGEPRYSQRVCRELGRVIACRIYAKPVLQLCHLVNAADACGAGADRWERFFFASHRATPGGFRGYLDHTLAIRPWRRSGIERVQEGIVIGESETTFTVTFSRMPFLAALLDFLVGTVGYDELDPIFGEMTDGAPDPSAIGTAANAVSRLLYAYLGEHLPTVQNTAKFNAMLKFLERRSGEGTIEIDDPAVLEFWRERCTAEGGGAGDFRTYRTVFEAFVALMRALEEAADRDAVERARPLGTDPGAGEVDPDEGWAEFEFADKGPSPLDVLAAEPASRIKFLTKVEREHLNPLIDAGPAMRHLPMSLLRSVVFGRAQARLTQALKNKLATAEIREQIRSAPDETYIDRAGIYRKLEDHLERVLVAAAHVLLHDEGAEAVGNVVALRPDDPVVTFEQGLDNPASLPQDQMRGVMEDARTAFKSLTRSGFDDAAIDDAGMVEGFRMAVAALTALRDETERYRSILEDIDRGDPGLQGRFGRDRDVFQNRFMHIYGTVE